MDILSSALIIIGVILLFGGALMNLVRAFEQGVLWGLGSLFIPIVSIAFLIVHWAKARRSLFCSIGGVVLMLVGALMAGDTWQDHFVFAAFKSFSSDGKKDAGDLTASISKVRERIEVLEGQSHSRGTELAKQFQALDLRRKSLKAGDNAAVQQFNIEAEAYTQQNNAHKAVVAELESTRKDLQRLLDERSTLRANSAPAEVEIERPASAVASTPNVPAKEIIMYTTSRCPACTAAKTYMARKGIRYDERNVEHSSTAAEEFRKLGGRGVPLIMVGNQKMSGFNARQLEQMIGS